MTIEGGPPGRPLVADASALVELVLNTSVGKGVALAIAERSNGTGMHVPALCDIEVASALRSGLLAERMTRERAGRALEAYLDLPITRHGHTGLLGVVLRLRDRLSAYDAAYIALALDLEGEFLTADRRLARAVSTGIDLPVMVV